jgi:hypothetical protein
VNANPIRRHIRDTEEASHVGFCLYLYFKGRELDLQPLQRP